MEFFWFEFHTFTSWKIVKGRLRISFIVRKTTRNTTCKTAASSIRTGRWDRADCCRYIQGCQTSWRPMQEVWKELRSSLAWTASKRRQRTAARCSPAVTTKTRIPRAHHAFVTSLCINLVPRIFLWDDRHSRTQSPSYAQCDEGLWPNPYSELASDWLVLTLDIVFLPCFCGIRLWIWPEPLGYENGWQKERPWERGWLCIRSICTVSCLHCSTSGMYLTVLKTRDIGQWHVQRRQSIPKSGGTDSKPRRSGGILPEIFF
jgi:hypothetical protein